VRRLLLTLVLTFTVLSSPAATSSRDPVTVALQLYGDCISARLSAELNFKPKEKDALFVIDYYKQLDAQCVAWTYLWLDALIASDITRWSASQSATFYAARAYGIEAFVTIYAR
jgi:hypothetical protein